MAAKMTQEMQAEFDRENADRRSHGEPLIDEDRFVYVWELDDQLAEREEVEARNPQGYIRARADGKM